MGCSQSAPSPGQGPRPRPVPREIPPTSQPREHKPATANHVQPQSRAVSVSVAADHAPSPQQVRQNDAHDVQKPSAETSDTAPAANVAAAVQRKPESPESAAAAAAAATINYLLAAGHIELSFNDDRQSLQSLQQLIRDRPGMAAQDQLPRDAIDVRVLFSKAVWRGGRVSPRQNSLFVYEPLPTPSSIRVLRLLPKDTDGMIRCELKTIDLKQIPAPRFACLSYTWGNPLASGVGFTGYEDAQKTGEFGAQNRRPISCNGRLLYIGQNLHDAFEQLPVHPGNYATDKDIQTSLHEMAAKGRTRVVYWLLLEGAPVNALDADGKTALHLAAAKGHRDVVYVLLSSGCDPQQVDYSGKKAADCAWEGRHDAIVELIRSFTPDKRVALPTDSERRAATIDSPQYLWVDAICINQEDVEEKTRQVNMMDQIYKAAELTTIWLGREDHHTKTAVDFILKLYPVLDRLREAGIATYQAMSPETSRAIGLPSISQQEWDALASIYLRQWFRRVWVLQEVALAQEVVCFCGPHQIPWHFVSVTKILDQLDRYKVSGGSFRYIPPHESPSPVQSNFALFLNCRDRRMLDEMGLQTGLALGFQPGPDGRFLMPLVRLVLDCWTLSSTDPRDKIFALLALSRGDPGAAAISADYALSVEQVYAQITRLMIVQRIGEHDVSGDPNSRVGPLYILSCVVHKAARLQTLPSWVPDFSTLAKTTLENKSFRAAGAQSYAIEWATAPAAVSAPWNELRLRGCRLGTITGATTQRQVTGRATQYFFDATWFELLRTTRTPYPTGQPLSEVLWRTLCADQDRTGTSPAPAALGSKFRDLVSTQLLVDATAGADYTQAGRDALFELLGLWSTDNLAGSGQTSMHDTTLGITIDLGAGRISASRQYPAWFQALIDAEEGRSFIPTLSYVREFGRNLTQPIWDAQQQSFISPPGAEGEYFAAFGKAFGGRRMFKMVGDGDDHDGGVEFLGISDRGLQLGDEVWAVAGSKVPFVLRAGGDGKHRLVGDAFVHGAMGGERWRSELKDVVLV